VFTFHTRCSRITNPSGARWGTNQALGPFR